MRKKMLIYMIAFLFSLCACGKSTLADEVAELRYASMSSQTIDDYYELIDSARKILKKFEANGLNSDEYVDLFAMFGFCMGSNISDRIDWLEWEYRTNEEELEKVALLAEEYSEFVAEVQWVSYKTNFSEKYTQYLNKLNEEYYEEFY